MLHKGLTAGVWMAVAVALSSCNGVPGSSDVEIPSQRPTGTVSGFAVDDPIAAADVRVFAFDGGVKGALLASTTTDSTGAYSLELRSKDRPVLVEISGGYYNELLSGQRVELNGAQQLTAVSDYRSGQPLTTMVTPLTHLAAALAHYKIAQGGAVQAAIADANREVSQLFGVDVVTTFPRSIAESGQGAPLSSEQLYGFQLAALAGWSQWASDQNGVTAQSTFSTVALSQLMAADLRADGRLDGRGLNVEGDGLMDLAFGVVPLNADLYRVGLAQQLLTMAAHPLNRTAAAASDLLPVAQGMAARGAALLPVPASNSVGSFNIYSVEPESFYHNGTIEFALLVDRPSAVAALRFELDGLWIGDAANPAAPTVRIDTTAYSDGPHLLRVTAKSQLGDEVVRSFTLNIDNSAPFINLTSPPVTHQQEYLATFTVGDSSAGVWRLLVEGKQIPLEQNRGQAALTLSVGKNSIPVTIIDVAGNRYDTEMVIALDQTAPQFGAGGGHSEAQFDQAGSVTRARLQDENGVPLRIETARADLDGVVISRAALNDSAIPYFALSAADPLLEGVGSGSKVKVEARYEREGVATGGWRTVAAVGGEYLLPLATETLAPEWLNATPMDTHGVRVRLTDEAGNSSEKLFSFKTSFVVSPLTLKPVADLGESFFGSVGFNSRAELHNRRFAANSYSFTNNTGKAFYLRLGEAASHSASRHVETLVRKHNVRLKTTTEWQARAVVSTVTNVCPVLGEYQAVAEIQNHTSSGWQTQHPPAVVLGDEALVSSDAPTLPTDHGAWENLPHFDGEFATAEISVGEVVYSFTFDYLIEGDSATAPLAPLYLANWTKSVDSPSGCPERGPLLQQRKQYEYESLKIGEVQTPANFYASESEQKGFSGTQFAVHNDDTGQPITDVAGWFLIPANHTITITKTLQTPGLTVDNDPEVVSPSPVVGYTPRRYDKRIEWSIGREITLTAAHNAGYDNLPAMSRRTVTVGTGQRQYQISR